MQYAEIITPVRKALIALEPTGWDEPYQRLFDQTDTSGWEEWLLYKENNFNNLFQKADEKRYKERSGFAVIFRDIVRNGGKGEKNGKLNIDYISHAGTEWEKKHSNIWAPKSGDFWVPTDDGVFYEDTLIPFETMADKKEAIKRLESKGIPKEQLSKFYRPERYGSGSFVSRDFDPDFFDGGCFGVYASRRPFYSGDDGVASRPAYGNPEIVMEVNAL